MKRIKNKLGLLIILLTIVSIVSILPVTYTIYKSGENIDINTVSGELIYDVVLDEQSTYIDETTNNPYFYITIKNNKEGNLSDADIEYNIEITNKTGSSGLYSYELEGGTYSTPDSTLTISDYLLKGEAAEKTYKVMVSSPSLDETTVEYDINYNVSQKRMDS